MFWLSLTLLIRRSTAQPLEHSVMMEILATLSKFWAETQMVPRFHLRMVYDKSCSFDLSEPSLYFDLVSDVFVPYFNRESQTFIRS